VVHEPLQLGVVEFGGCLAIAGLAGKVAQVDDEIRLPTVHFVHKRAKVFFITRRSSAQQMAIRGYAKSHGRTSVSGHFASAQGGLNQKTDQRQCR